MSVGRSDTAASSRARLVATAKDLFARQGYNGTGLNQLLADARAPKGSFYHHFPDGKEALGAEAVTQAGGEIGALIDRAFAQAGSFREGATRMATFVADWFERTDYAAGCPITSVLLETAPACERLTAACAAVYDDWTDRVAGHATRLGVDAPHAFDLATGLVLAVEGAWIIARARRSKHPFEIAAAMAGALADAQSTSKAERGE